MTSELLNKHAEFLKTLQHVEILDTDERRMTIALNVRGGEYVARVKNNDLQNVIIVLGWIENFNLEEVDYGYFRKLLTCVGNVDTLFYQSLFLGADNLSKRALDIFVQASEYTLTYKIINTELFQSLKVELDVINARTN
ncbi:hypothetical protein [Sulfurospirillum barnesii]|uniref:Uncharacterized protein n=1 Tax=Sulfurospirillum barnesii (strain ATCC 700032 / DSM 10660 / SES-3) TaxID=760154 RepID=I3XX71_SULBS|nr:hypothetical protein [Sulfurospirillum barnesii]AFL68545.1 hypothetical protein Sulba_1251 [Sulfurospirillum barnesii SES-3]